MVLVNISIEILRDTNATYKPATSIIAVTSICNLSITFSGHLVQPEIKGVSQPVVFGIGNGSLTSSQQSGFHLINDGTTVGKGIICVVG